MYVTNTPGATAQVAFPFLHARLSVSWRYVTTRKIRVLPIKSPRPTHPWSGCYTALAATSRDRLTTETPLAPTGQSPNNHSLSLTGSKDSSHSSEVSIWTLINRGTTPARHYPLGPGTVRHKPAQLSSGSNGRTRSCLEGTYSLSWALIHVSPAATREAGSRSTSYSRPDGKRRTLRS